MHDPIAYQKSITLLQQATTPKGILASIIEETNYRRIWARDSVICGLAGLLAADEVLIQGLKNSLVSLAGAQGKHGEIPSNVQFNAQGVQESLSFGGLCGRVDTVGWWIVGLCNYVHHEDDQDFAQKYLPQVEKGLQLLDIWEFNGRGLVYVPQSGDWADEYILRGYILYDQLLRLWALEAAAAIYKRADWLEQGQALRQCLAQNYWIEAEKTGELYHEHAFHLSRKQQGDSNYWEASFSPGGYIRKFDLLANSLALLLGIGTAKQTEALLQYTQGLLPEQPMGQLPSFWPPIFEGDQEWYLLAANHKYEFRNLPYEFHNGGLWPAFNGFWGMALTQVGQTQEASDLLRGIKTSVAKANWGFYECFHGQTGATSGTRCCTWSAAGLVMLQQALQGKQLFFGA